MPARRVRDSHPDLTGDPGARTFLASCWQKRPRLLRGAIPGFKSFITPAGLRALACRRDVESRLVLQRGGDYPWQVMHGPFRRRQLESLPPSHWTLLVQHVDLHCAEGAELLRRFRFVPDWRIDDLMVSLAPRGGSVGAHVDHYDVFLLQAAGRRRWGIRTRGFNPDHVIAGIDLRILRKFRAARRWVLSPGDMLYLPPGVAHHGVALEECLTFSVGFRAPGARELAGHFIESLDEDGPRYADPDLRLQRHPAEITAAARARLRAMLRDMLGDSPDLDRWFGRMVTTLPDGIEATPPQVPIATRVFLARWRRTSRLARLHPARAVFMRQGNLVRVYINGCEFTLPWQCRRIAVALADEGHYEGAPPARLDPREIRVLREMFNRGFIGFPRPD